MNKVGEGLIYCSSYIDFSKDLIKNTQTKIIFNSPVNFNVLKDIIKLDEKQENYYRKLPDNKALIILPGFNDPFVITFSKPKYPRFSIDRDDSIRTLDFINNERGLLQNAHLTGDKSNREKSEGFVLVVLVLDSHSAWKSTLHCINATQ